MCFAGYELSLAVWGKGFQYAVHVPVAQFS